MKKRVLIIKLGYCETLINEQGFVPSLGDVFRHTVLLHHYANDEVTWLTSKSAEPLLKDNPFINKLVIYNENTASEMAGTTFDEVLCLEKSHTLSQIADSVNAVRRLGFRTSSTATLAHHGSHTALNIANGQDHFLSIQSVLFQMVGDYWNGENYILGYKPKQLEPFDVGLNFRVGTKWPSKQWPEENWKELERLLIGHDLKVNWQKGETDLYEYMDWINAGRMTITCDSLGMHLAIAMNKKVVALFGPTPADDIYMYGKGVILSAEWACSEAPCLKSECDQDQSCMRELNPKMVARAVINILNGRNGKK